MKGLIILFSLFLSLGISAKVKTSYQGSTLNLEFSVEGIKSERATLQNQEFSKLSLIGLGGFQGIYYKVGYPEIPVIRFYALTKDPKSIFVELSEPEYSSELLTSVYPSQEPLVKILGATRALRINQSTYMADAFFPGKKYTVEDAGSVRGVPQKLITIFPIQYNPISGEFKNAKKIKVSYTSTQIAQPTQNVFVFVVGEKFGNLKSLNDYIAFKKTLGFKTIKLVVGTDVKADPEDIRAKLKGIWKQYKQNFRYVLIVGDAEDVPSKEATNISGVTDHYYRAIDTDNYNTDINGPDVGVGRITVNTEVELTNVLNKFLKYQKGTFGSTSWFNKISFIATDDQFEIAEGSHNYAIEKYTSKLGYSGTFPKKLEVGGDKLYAITHKATGANVVDKAREGRAIINYSGHGSNYGWAGPDVSQSDIPSLNHPDALPFVISNACITGDFTVAESFGETWIKHPKGAIMFWGSMDSSYWDEDDILERTMYDGIFTLGNKTFAQITDYALSQVWKYYGGVGKSKYYWETYVIFGDPSISLRLAQ